LPKRGVSVPEIAANSRSQHKSQGFGSSGTRGEALEYLDLIKGELPPNSTDPFAGINTTWTRVPGGAPVGKAVDAAIAKFDFQAPANNLPALLNIRTLIEELPDGHWKTIKLAEANAIIEGTLGLFLEAVASDKSAAPGQAITLNIEAINRSSAQVRLRSMDMLPALATKDVNADLVGNKGQTWKEALTLPTTLPLSNAYWLNEKATLGMFNVPDPLLRGLPETPPVLAVRFNLEVQDPVTKKWIPLAATKPVVYKTTDPVKGELYAPFEVTPPVFVGLESQVYMFADAAPREISVKVTAGQPNVAGTVSLDYPTGWRLEPASQPFELVRKDQEVRLKFTLYPAASAAVQTITPKATIGAATYTRDRITIQYDHIPTQTLVRDATAKVVRLDIAKRGENIGYLMGAGDEIPQALEAIGYRVTLLEDRDMNAERLSAFDAVIVGVRAYNTLDRMPNYQPALLEYTKAGGTLIIQYNTNGRLKIPNEELGPYPLKISRDRVTVEEAEVRFLAPNHPVLNTPNAITAADFEGWVQERGLYFPNEWAPEYTAILSCNDPSEPARDGGLLVTQYGKGHYIYTGYSWFRELPAGVPGAYRLFANLISLGN
jgi:hypothetical protein